MKCGTARKWNKKCRCIFHDEKDHSKETIHNIVNKL
jgi:hypothetical protein